MKWRPSIGLFFVVVMTAYAAQAGGKKASHPFDLFKPEVHEMHNAFFGAASITCDLCHANPESFANRKKINRLGCHHCHNSPNPPLPASQDCSRCHPNGPPKPPSHRVDWIAKHQNYAKQDPASCTQCHTQQKFCLDCHMRRDTVQEKAHRRNFKFFHSIEARMNPRKCDACHTVDYCQQCHSGQGNSLK